MLKRILILAAIALMAFACNSKQQTKVDSLNVAQLLEVIDQNIDQELTIIGTVNHVCSHSGRRCFLIDSTGEYSIRVEAAGQIESFSKEVMGTEIKVKGIVKEERMTAAEIDEYEAQVLEKHPEEAETDGETCSAEMSNINNMREWMKEHNKDYYAIYYFEGQSYEMVE